MYFDKDQQLFPSDFHRDVWWWAVGLVPPEDSLTEDVRKKCSPDIIEGCYQWYSLFNELCEDMYNHASEYIPVSPRQYRDILENISANGKLQDNGVSWALNDWESYVSKINKSKAYTSSGITISQCLKALERTGLNVYTGNIDNTVIFSYDKYPKVFHAMQTMEKSPNVRDTPVRHHFAHCEFRQLFKRYDANYNELLRRASDDSLYVAHTAHDFAKSLKVQRYIHFGIIKYKHKGIRVFDIDLHGNEYPTLRINIGTCANPDADLIQDDFYKNILDKDISIQKIFIDKINKCQDNNHNHQSIIINGKEISLCSRSRISINPIKSELDAVLCFINARKASIDQYIKD